LAGGSGAWSNPWNKTHQVINVTLPEYDLTDEKTVQHFSNLPNVFGIFFACPCTVWSNAGNKYFSQRDPYQLLHHFRIFMGGYRIIQSQKQKLAFWVIENPVGKMKHLLGRRQASFHPYQYPGHDIYKKLTLLWGDFIMPQKLALTTPLKRRRQYRGYKKYQHETRSITPAGFAHTFYMVNNPYGRLRYLLAGLNKSN
jgi:hypothetical protein